jgi:solute carrier family 35 (UDP-sugar transporter), member A1/2/3
LFEQLTVRDVWYSQYADNVLKGLATGVSVVFATALSTILFHTPLTPQFSLGALLILISVYVFSNPIYFATRSKSKQETEMKSLLPK